MKLDNEKKYTSFMARLYEEDYNDIEVLNLVHTLSDSGFDRVCVVLHTKSDAKAHFHILALGRQFRPSKLYELGLKEHELSTCENRKGAYFYITKHQGISEEKKEEDRVKHHRIEVIYDTILYKESSRGCKTASLSDFIDTVDEIFNETQYISKMGLLRALQKRNEAFMGLYLRYYRFIEEIYGRALFELRPPAYDNSSED